MPMLNAKKALGLMLILVSLLTISGCWDRQELEDHAYVVAIGTDIAQGSSKEKIFTAQFVIPSKLAGGGAGSESSGGGGGGEAFFQVSIRANNLFNALDKMQAQISRHISLLQCRAIFISEDIARQSVLPSIELVERNPELRRSVFVAVVQGSAKEYLQKNKPELHNNISKYYEEISRSNRFTGYSTISTFQRITDGIETPGESAVMALTALNTQAPGLDQQGSEIAGKVPSEDGTNAQYMGVAVFHRDKMVGKLDKRQTQLLNMLRGDWQEAPFIIKDPMHPGMTLGLKIRQERMPKITVDVQNEPVQINVQLSLVGSLISQNSFTDYTSSTNRRKMEDELKNELEGDSSALIEQCQKEFHADVFRFGNVGAKKQFLTWQEWQDFNWPEKFPQAEVYVSADVSIKWYGMQNQPAQPAQ